MSKITVDHSVFEVDESATEAYYSEFPHCGCVFCRNYASEILRSAPGLAEALRAFGVDVCYPDANKCYDLPDRTVCYLPSYTVFGHILFDGQQDLELGNVRAVACKKLSEHPGEPERFSIVIYCVKGVPWTQAMPFDEAFPPIRKPFRFLPKKAKSR